MNHLNSILIEGNLARDPEFRKTAQSVAICAFAIASVRYSKQEGELKKEVSYFEVKAYSKLAEFVRLVRKGRGVRVVGRLQQERRADDDGRQHSKVIIVAEHIDFRPETEPEKNKETVEVSP
jgi:single-strand DNA-binding protein